MAGSGNELAKYYLSKEEGPTVLVTLFNPAGKANEMEVETIIKGLRPSIDNPGVGLVVFDLSQVEYFSSVGLSLLLRVHKALKARKGKIALAKPNANIKELLHVTSLDTIWQSFPTLEEAIGAIKPQA
jgi:anti-sigma B factor antagonist